MEQIVERKILIDRFVSSDRALYKLGRRLGISWFNKFQAKFSRDQYAYFAPEEKISALDLVARHPSDRAFVEALNDLGPWKYLEIDRFIGERYFFDGSSFSLQDRRAALTDEVRRAVEETGRRGVDFLRAMISLYHAGRWDKAYGGAAWPDILAKIREMGGSYPSPRDLAILKSYKIYYRTGSRRYPTHTIPEEMIPTIEEVLANESARPQT
jgi:hypothetical protein